MGSERNNPLVCVITLAGAATGRLRCRFAHPRQTRRRAAPQPATFAPQPATYAPQPATYAPQPAT